jgi:ABC-type Fe3+ transport system permease subunit
MLEGELELKIHPALLPAFTLLFVKSASQVAPPVALLSSILTLETDIIPDASDKVN